MVDVTMPNGDVVSFPDDMPKEQIRGLIASKFPEVAPQPPQAMGGGQAFTTGLEQGVNPFSDEMRAFGAGVGSYMRGGDYNQAYEQRLGELRGDIQSAKESHPYMYGAGNVAGVIGLPVVSTPKIIAQGIGNVTARGIPQAAATVGGLGAIQGGLYASGESEKPISERLPETGRGAAFGGVVGAVGGAAFPLMGRALKAFAPKPKVTQAVTTVDETIKPVQEVAEQSGRNLLKGAQTGDIEMMRAEEMARQGLLGSDMQTYVNNADKAFLDGVKSTARSLIGKSAKETPEETFSKAVNIVKRRYDAEKRVASSLMNKRNNALAKTKIYKDYINDTLAPAMDELRKTDDFQVNLLKEANKGIKDEFDILKKLTGGKNVKSVNMTALGAWRSGLNSYPKGSQQSVLAGEIAKTYDGWLDGITRTAFKEGDEEMVKQIFAANKNYAQFKNKYGTDARKGMGKVFEDIITKEELTPRKVANMTFGKSLAGNDMTEQYVKRLIEAVPEPKQEQVKGFMRAGLFQRAFENAYDDVSDVVSLGAFKKNLLSMSKNPSYKKYLSTPEHSKVMNDLIMDITKYQHATSGKTITAPSAPMLGRMAQMVGSMPVLKNLTLTRGAAEAVNKFAKMGANAKDVQTVEKSLAEFYREINPIIEESARMRFYGGLSGGAVGQKLAGDE